VSTVLYVDDEEAIRRALTSWLTRRGHTVLTAGSSQEALSILTSRDDIDAMFIDIWLGHESGFDLFEWVDMNRPKLVERTAFVKCQTWRGSQNPATSVARRAGRS